VTGELITKLAARGDGMTLDQLVSKLTESFRADGFDQASHRLAAA
jgi:hypothetical protein